ncbi:hypothetical protein [Thalassococcus sp. S3]|uniref:hypothetical protein n=1 Tax=Thalassococcus sp. S3 TaxID=2017482 RepID=UPI00102BE826|nr:hypothetical protein [Thalassococcus sp. S3]
MAHYQAKSMCFREFLLVSATNCRDGERALSCDVRLFAGFCGAFTFSTDFTIPVGGTAEG